MKIPYEDIYEKMLLIRKFEEMLLELFSKGELFGTTHTYVGQEAIAVSLVENIKPDDIIFSNHRCHGHFLAKEDDPEGLLAEIMGREKGVCGGRGGSQHLQKNNFYSNGIQGGIVANSLGMAFVEKYNNTNNIVITFIGDGTWGEGIVYESLNMASLLSVPLLLVVENNMYAQSTPIELNLAGTILQRAQAFGISCDEISSNNFSELYPIFNAAVKYVRTKKKPFVQIINTYRLNAHSKGDDDRSEKEILKNWENEPLQYIEKNITHSKVSEIKRSVDKRLKSVLDKVKEMKYASLT